MLPKKVNAATLPQGPATAGVEFFGADCQERARLFYYWIDERHSIYCKRKQGAPAPWTDDAILQHWKFTNVFRELDRTTQWMRANWTGPHLARPWPEILFNVALFRYFGSSDFFCPHAGGTREWSGSAALPVRFSWVALADWNPAMLIDAARTALNAKMTVFTGAYVVSNFGKSEPKEAVIANYVLQPLAMAAERIAKLCTQGSLQVTFDALRQLYGFGGNGFMAYEVVSDLRWTPLLTDPIDEHTWANAGPGAQRGLNRIWGRPLNAPVRPPQANLEMRELLRRLPLNVGGHVFAGKHKPAMREIEHSLCEFDKYMRLRNGEGEPRSRYDGTGKCHGQIIT